MSARQRAHARAMLRDRFTNVACALWALGLYRGPASDAWAVGACLSVFAAASFHAVLVFDAGAFARFRARHGWSARVFHAGNVLLHVLPAAYAVAHPPPLLRPAHACVAHALYYAWAAYHTRGTLLLDALYVPLPPHAWHFAHACGTAAVFLYLERQR